MESNADDLTLRDYLAPVFARKWMILAFAVVVGGAHRRSRTRLQDFDASVHRSGSRPHSGHRWELQRRPNAGEPGHALDLPGCRDRCQEGDLIRRYCRVPGKQGPASPATGADFITITASGRSPKEAADIANGFAQAFISLRSATQRDSAAQVLKQLRKQLDAIPKGTENGAARQEIEANIRRLEVVTNSGTGNAKQIDPAIPPRRALGTQAWQKALASALAASSAASWSHISFTDSTPRSRRWARRPRSTAAP